MELNGVNQFKYLAKMNVERILNPALSVNFMYTMTKTGIRQEAGFL